MFVNKPLDNLIDDYFLYKCLLLAKKAESIDEVPIGSIVVCDGLIVGEGYNLKETKNDCTLHGEMIAIRQACSHLSSWRLSRCVLYSSLEPCLMCSATLVQCRIQRVVFAAKDPKAGALGSVFSLHNSSLLNHRFQVDQTVNTNLLEQSAKLLKSFFAAKRQVKK